IFDVNDQRPVDRSQSAAVERVGDVLQSAQVQSFDRGGERLHLLGDLGRHDSASISALTRANAAMLDEGRSESSISSGRRVAHPEGVQDLGDGAQARAASSRLTETNATTAIVTRRDR